MSGGWCGGRGLPLMSRGEEEKEKKTIKGSIYHFGVRSRQPGFQFRSATHQLCDLGQVPHPLWALAFLSVAWGEKSYLLHEVVVKIK